VRLGKGIAVIRTGIALVAALHLTVTVFAQGPAFVPQLSDELGAGVTQAGTASGAFVTQVPADARPRTAPRASPPRALEQRQFIVMARSEADDNEALVVNEDMAIVPFTPGNRPDLPAITQGVTVSLNINNELLPNVGEGAVVL
jgi:hypothetical protein